MLIFPILALIYSFALWVIFGKPRFLPKPTDSSSAKISIIIPARDEEDNIARLLESIISQEVSAHETIVVNDGSTDQTAAIATSLGASVIEAQELPEGWKGKPWACQQGAEAASGSWLLFLDADTYMTSSSFTSQLSRLTEIENHVFSICPWHEVKRPYEQLSVFFNLLMVIGIDSFGAKKSSANNTRLVGQSMLISKNHYDECGGHSTVKSEILENYQLSDTLREKSIQRLCYLGKGSLNMRMFSGGFLELWHSWKKGFTSGAAAVSSKIIIWTSVWITGMIIATASIVLALSSSQSPSFLYLSIAAYGLHFVVCIWAFKKVGSFSVINALLFPLSLVFYHVLFFSALIDKKRGKKVAWKGRDVS